MSDAEDYGVRAGDGLGPLFAREREGPFGRSRMRPTAVEAAVAAIIWARGGRGNPISIAEIIRVAALRLPGAPVLGDRKIKEIVQQLRVAHRCAIGARRTEPAGYFWMLDAEDYADGLRPYREQLIEGWRVLRALDSQERLLELRGQLVLGVEDEGATDGV